MRTPRPHPPIRVLPVDDSVFAREGIRAILELDQGIRIVGEAETRVGAMEETTRRKPDVVIMDMRLPDGTGPEACRDILSAYPKMRVLFFSAYSNDRDLYNAIMAGGHGYLTKDSSAKDLLAAIKTVAAGRSLFGPKQTTHLVSWVKDHASERSALSASPLTPPLTPMEQTVLSMLADGATNKAIATALQKEPNTITKLLSTLSRKLRVSRRTQAVHYFVTQLNQRLDTSNAPDDASVGEG